MDKDPTVSLIQAVESLQLEASGTCDPLNKFREKLAKDGDLSSEEGYWRWVIEGGDNFLSNCFAKYPQLVEAIECSDEISYGTEDLLEYNFTNYFLATVHLAFANLILDNEAQSREALENASKALENYTDMWKRRETLGIEAERLEGAQYILQSIKNLVSIRYSDTPDIASEGHFDDLCNSAKAFVYIAKGKFIGEFGKKDELKLKTYEQALELDPENWEWSLFRFKQLRWDRRKGNLRGRTTELEKQMIEKAIKLNPDHPVCLIRTYQFLAEYVKGCFYDFKHHGYPLNFADKWSFEDQDAVEFLRCQTVEFEKKFPKCARWFNEFGKIFSSDLPFTLRDRDLARKYLEMAVDASPNSSPVKHRMAVFLRQEKQFIEAEPYLVQSLAIDFRNHPARLDLSKLWLAKPSKNRAKLEELFSYEEYHSFPLGISLQLKYLEGYFLFMIEKETEAVKIWIECMGTKTSDSKGKDGVSFSELVIFGKQWGWSGVDLGRIKSTLKRSSPVEPSKEFLLLLKNLEDAVTTVHSGNQSRGQRFSNSFDNTWSRGERGFRPPHFSNGTGNRGSDSPNWRK